MVPGLIVLYSTVPRRKRDASATRTCYISVKLTPFFPRSLKLTWTAALTIGIITKNSQSPLPILPAPHPQHELSNLLCLPHSNSYDCLPRPVTVRNQDGKLALTEWHALQLARDSTTYAIYVSKHAKRVLESLTTVIWLALLPRRCSSDDIR